MRPLIEPGDIFTTYNPHDQRWITYVFLRPCDDADLEGVDTWGYAAVNEFGRYWRCCDLATGEVDVVMDNLDKGWVKLSR